MKKGISWFGLFAAIGLLITISACRKESFLDAGKVELAPTTDTLVFDTVFSTVGSTTRSFKLLNTSGGNIKIGEIFLAGRKFSGTSPYRLNINGQPTNSLKDFEVEDGDSIYVFAEVTIDPTTGAMPFVVRDSVGYSTGKGTKYVLLEAYGQNANILFGRPYNIITKDTTWTADLPILLATLAYVPPGVKLTILPGARIYSARYSGIFIEGEIDVRGGCDTADRVLMRGDRLGAYYKDLPGGWQGVRLLPGGSGTITGADILNAEYGIRADSLPKAGLTYNVEVNRCKLFNHRVVGLWGFSASIAATNTLVYDCGQFTFLAQGGGQFAMKNCTFANTNTQGRFGHSDPGFGFSNKPYISSGIRYQFPVNATLENCIVTGDLEEEIGLEDTSGVAFSVTATNCLLKTERSAFNGNGNLINTDPNFKSVTNQRFELLSTSAALGKGTNNGVNDDLRCRPRPSPPSIGAFEVE